MIISRTPFRVSLFGGGTDYPDWIREHGGAVLGMANPGATRIALSQAIRILFTGASSVIGYWLVRRLVAAGYEVVAACRGDNRYEGLRAERVRVVRQLCETRFGCAFGSDDFLALAGTSYLRSTKPTVSPNLHELTEGALRLRTIYP
jgi:hypothetical protein